ncbi:lysophospholipid acyltransferase family protein [Xylocopilactobacillus apicola]|uniref:1-acyl-sn-glycerol-3-phosphate acyltransferase n=1 Tax=Xylocopilactobacillus apicola TaxID=2932184 RepID=A0AAU9D898_9LACO|nr:1-acyl-sn-glycerol-3-phosphate acyltransferase [Xylocopilactobacillus apicola]BDR58616.1 1-acyl-sn-glycerol-3-phosphate acyltransferase [Xylocopilactobacillus apicola]
MFYKFMSYVIKFLIWILNGNVDVQNKEVLKDKTYIFVGPHRTWWDPIFTAYAVWPLRLSFMTKKELFDNFFIRFILVHVNAFPVDRKNPKPSVIKVPVKNLKSGQLSLLMYPSGTRYSESMKGGVALIDKMTKSEIIPVVYQGPVTFKGLLKRQRITIRFGEALDVDYSIKDFKEFSADLDQKMQKSFAEIDQKIDPNFKYIPNEDKLELEKKKGHI